MSSRNCPLRALCVILHEQRWDEQRGHCPHRSSSSLLLQPRFCMCTLYLCESDCSWTRAHVHSDTHVAHHAAERSHPAEDWLRDSEGDSSLVSLIRGDTKQPGWVPQLTVPLLHVLPPFWSAVQTHVVTMQRPCGPSKVRYQSSNLGRGSDLIWFDCLMTGIQQLNGFRSIPWHRSYFPQMSWTGPRLAAVSVTPIILQDKKMCGSPFKLAAAKKVAAVARRNKQQILFLISRDSVRLKPPESDFCLDVSVPLGLQAMINLNLNMSAENCPSSWERLKTP